MMAMTIASINYMATNYRLPLTLTLILWSVIMLVSCTNREKKLLMIPDHVKTRTVNGKKS